MKFIQRINNHLRKNPIEIVHVRFIDYINFSNINYISSKMIYIK